MPLMDATTATTPTLHAAPDTLPSGAAIVRLDRARRVVAGVVLDPYVIDLQGDWIPPGEVRDTAHRWLSDWGVLGDEHERKAEGVRVVESWVVPYPPGQEELADRLEPHTIYSLPYGSDRILSGSWVLAVRATTDEAWARMESGDWAGFSIRGTARARPLDARIMPRVEVLAL
jgi:hypothetical protein